MMSHEEVAKYLFELDQSFTVSSVRFAKAYLVNDEEKTAAELRQLLITESKMFALRLVLK